VSVGLSLDSFPFSFCYIFRASSENVKMCWAETYTYDAWGNLLSLGPNSSTQPNYVGCMAAHPGLPVNLDDQRVAELATRMNYFSEHVCGKDAQNSACNLVEIAATANSLMYRLWVSNPWVGTALYIGGAAGTVATLSHACD
jgi:hypothetical protein